MENKSKKNTKKKEKIVYVDDGSTVADMSGLSSKPNASQSREKNVRPRATFKEQWKTYTDAVKMMVLPMLAVLGIIALAFLLVYIIL